MTESDIEHSGHARARDLVVRELDSLIGSAELWRHPKGLRSSVPVPVKKQIRYVVLTAIEVELQAAFHSPLVQSYIKLPQENSFLTHVQRDDGMLMPVILSCVGEAGRVPASIAALNLIQKYQPDFLILVGIAGSIGPTEDEDTPLGDIVIAENIIDYEPGKYRGEKLESRAVNTTCGLAPEMKQFVKDGWTDGDCAKLFEKSSKRKAKRLYLREALRRKKIDLKKLSKSEVNKYAKIKMTRSDKTFGQWGADLLKARGKIAQVHSGVVLSGDKVVASQVLKDELRDNLSGPDKLKLRAVEMEAGGVVRAINAFPSKSRPNFGMVRGICDDASEGKDDEWHGLAADLAVAFAMEFIFWHASRQES